MECLCGWLTLRMFGWLGNVMISSQSLGRGRSSRSVLSSSFGHCDVVGLECVLSKEEYNIW